MYLGLGIIFFIVSILFIGLLIFTTVRKIKNNGEVLSEKNFFYLVPTFLIIFAMHIVAAAFNGENIEFFYCFTLINTTLDVLKFKVIKELLLPVCQAYPIYYIDFILAFVIAEATVILSVASLFSRRINNYLSVKLALRRNCDIVIGNSEDAINYVKRTKNSILLGDSLSNQQYIQFIKQGVYVLRVPLDAKRLAKRLNNGRYNVIVFRDGNYSYTKIIDTFMQLNNTGGFNIHLEANQQDMKILKERFITKADNSLNVCLSGFSKYELMARRFVADYPITKYIPRSFYNENLTLKNEKQINIVFIGFGKVNYQLFRMCAMQFQFAQEIDGKLASKPVTYYIFDNKSKSLNNEFFSKISYEFDEDFKDCDFPKPEKICDLKTYRTDINSITAKKKFKSLVTEDSFTYFIVSLENDLEDASYAQTLKRLLQNDNYRIFVRAKNNKGENLKGLKDCTIYFGEEKELYTHENIVNDDLTELAQRINLLYNQIKNPPEWLNDLQAIANANKEKLSPEQIKTLRESFENADYKKFMRQKWSELPYIEQASNLYHALNLPFKLNLLGFDMIKMANDSDFGVEEEEFNKRYINSGMKSGYNDYSFFFKTESSNVLAYIEHLRWNALYIFYDYKQMKKKDIVVIENRNEKGEVKITMLHKNPDKKLQACLTTYYGLNQLIEYKYNTLYPNEKLSEADYRDNERLQALSSIYSYDYMDLDRLYGEITAMGYKLVRNDIRMPEKKDNETTTSI